MNQVLLVADNSGKHTGKYVDREQAHTGKGFRHLAVTVLLFNDKGQFLLQKRKHTVHGKVWDFTGSTHLLHALDGSDESIHDAVYRCLKEEYGIFQKVPLEIVGGVNYFAKDGRYCENEFDFIVLGNYNGVVKAKQSVAYRTKWVTKKSFMSDILQNPKKYAPWVVKAVDELPMLGVEFDQLLRDFLKKFEPFARLYFKNKKRELSKYPSLVKKFYSDLDDISAGGKRMRAFLIYLGYLIGGGKELKKILPISLAIEIVHTFLLIHDDIIDKSDTRRGKVTVHKRYEKIYGEHYGISQGIVIGDIACFEAMELVNSSAFDNAAKIECVKRLNKVLLETAYGEALDVEYSYKKAGIKEILNVADLKTARYSFVGPLSIGAIMGGASVSQLKAIEAFGLKIGLAFQIVDDLLGVFGDEKILGKSTLSDMREGKNTLLVYKAREMAKPADLIKLNKLWGKRAANAKDLEVVKAIFKASKAYDWCVSEMNSLKKDAVQNVAVITKDKKLQKIIIQMCDFIVSRSS